MPARLPDVVVVGAPRSGTTTLSHWLRAHPGVAFSHVKEVEYFDHRYELGPAWYLDQLPQDPGERCVIEATPAYLSDPLAPDRIARDLPHARFVAVLREPVARAWSNYWFFVQLGLEHRSWRRAIEEDEGGPHGYLWRGRYAEQLARWDALVGAERLHVLLFEDLLTDPVAAYAGICAFAGLEQLPPPGKESVNPTRLPRSRVLQRHLHSTDAGRLQRAAFRWNAEGRPVPTLDPREHTRLAGRFAQDQVALARRLRRDLPASWRPTTAKGATPAG